MGLPLSMRIRRHVIYAPTTTIMATGLQGTAELERESLRESLSERDRARERERGEGELVREREREGERERDRQTEGGRERELCIEEGNRAPVVTTTHPRNDTRRQRRWGL